MYCACRSVMTKEAALHVRNACMCLLCAGVDMPCMRLSIIKTLQVHPSKECVDPDCRHKTCRGNVLKLHEVR